jgi:hypothetical protein
MLIKQWINGFLKRHRARFDPHDWPTGEDTEESREFLRGWVSEFARQGVTEAEADLASQRLAATPPNYRRQHVPMVLEAVRAIRAGRGPGDGAETRESAWGLSRDCEHCGGEGLATVFHPRPSWALANRRPVQVAATCVCPLGRWIKRRHAQDSPVLCGRIPDLADVLDGRSLWRAEIPAEEVRA